MSKPIFNLDLSHTNPGVRCGLFAFVDGLTGLYMVVGKVGQLDILMVDNKSLQDPRLFKSEQAVRKAMFNIAEHIGDDSEMSFVTTEVTSFNDQPLPEGYHCVLWTIGEYSFLVVAKIGTDIGLAFFKSGDDADIIANDIAFSLGGSSINVGEQEE